MASRKTAHGLTLKQEAFCQELIKNKGSAAAAWRHAYDAENMSDNAIYVAACKLQDNPKVKQRLDELQERGRIVADMTLDGILHRLEKAYQLAMKGGQTAAAAQAAMGMAKLNGLIVDKSEQKHEVSRPEPKPDLNELLAKALPDRTVDGDVIDVTPVNSDVSTELKH